MTLPMSRVCPKQTKLLQQLSNQTELIEFLAQDYAAAVHSIWPDEHILEYLAADPGQRHIWHACISRHEPELWQRTEGEDLATDRRAFRDDKARTLIQRHFGDCPSGFLPALGRLSAAAKPAALYGLLYEQLQRGPETQKAIRHCKDLTVEFLRTLEVLDEELHSVAIVRNVENAVTARSINNAVRIFARKAGEYPYERIRVGLTQATTQMDISKAIDEMLAQIPFPKAPWPGDDMITPISSARALNSKAQHYQNCLSDFIPSIIKGERYFYEWHSKRPAIVELMYRGQLGWFLDDVLHANNEAVSDELDEEIRKTLASKGIYENGYFGAVRGFL